MAGKQETRKVLSKSILELKFMKKSKESAMREKEAAEGIAAYGGGLTGANVLFEPSFAVCESLTCPRRSYHGANPEIERYLESLKSARNAASVEEDVDVPAAEVARVTHASMSLYDVLGCGHDATGCAIRRAYLQLARIHHPDRGGRRENFLKISTAWRTLGNPKLRRVYDASLALLSTTVPVHAEIPLSQLPLDAEAGFYSLSCRCGGVFFASPDELCNNDKTQPLLIPCDNCSLYIRVIDVP